MDKLLVFVTTNPLLVTATVLTLVALVAFELRLRGRAGLELSIPEAVRMINNGATVVDVREPARYAAGHIVDAISLPSAELCKGEETGKIKKKRGILVVCEAGNESLQCTRRLRALGFEAAFSLGGGVAAWQRENQPLVASKR